MKKIVLMFTVAGLFVSCDSITSSAPQNDLSNIQSASVMSISSKSSDADKNQGDIWLGSLITETPQEGRELAIKMARKTIGAIQSNPEVKKRLRKEYAEDSEQLILSAQVVATEFQTVAEANNYWRK